MGKFNGLIISKYSLVHIATLCALAISHPLYDLLTKGDHATFFVAHQSKAIDVYIFVAILSVILPFFVFTVLWLLSLLSKPLGSALYAAVLTVLFTLLWLLIFGTLNIEFEGLKLAIPIALGVIATWLFVSKAWAQWAMSLMSIAVVLAPLIFLSNHTIRTFLSTPEAQDYSLISDSKELPTVVMIVFDELPLISLLDDKHLVDDGRYPNFARLANRSHWFRNTSTTHFSTRSGAIPSILTGWYPDTYRENSPEEQSDTNAPIQKQNMPLSIFSLLQTTHKIYAVESMSKLAPVNQLLENKGPPLTERLSSLSCDALVVYSHLVLPRGFGNKVPTIEGQWRDFCSFENTQLSPAVDWPYSGSRPANVRKFIESFDKNQAPAFYYLHSLLPHFPFQYDVNGEVHEPKLNVMTGLLRWVTGENRWQNETVANLAYQAHLIQLMFTDQLLGLILDRLVELNMFEQSMIILTADHGTTFYWDSEGLEPTKLKRIQASETMYVPLFIKLPDQSQGAVNDRLVETIDILPSVASVLNLQIPWKPDGVSVFADEEPDRERHAMIPQNVTFGNIIDPEYLSIQRKFRLFAAHNLDGLYLIGPNAEIVGKKVSSFSLLQARETARFLRPKYSPGPPKTATVQAYIEGSITNHLDSYDADSTKIAIALNGTIVNTTLSTSVAISELGNGRKINGLSQIEADGDVHFLARIPLYRWNQTTNDISVYVIEENQVGDPVSLIQVFSDP